MQTALQLPADTDINIIGESLRDIELIELTLERAVLRGSLHEFLKASWHIIEPSQPFVDNWHIRELCKLLQDIYLKNEPERRWIFNIPPGTLKSILVSVVFNAWVWARNPKRRFFAASYGSDLSMRDNMRVRQIIESAWFKERFSDCELADDQNAKGRFNTSKGGWRIATSVRGVGTGEHPDVIIIDDPLSAQQAMSAADRQLANDWLDQTLSSRGITRNVIVFVVMQRLHMDDPTGHLLSKGGWQHVSLPMRYETARPATQDDPGYQPSKYDTRIDSGELLFPQLFTEAKIKQLENDLGAYGTAGQLQQRPSPEGGGLFKRGDFQFIDAKPALARRVRGWDTAATEGGGDYTVGACVSEEFESTLVQGVKRTTSTGRIFVESIVRGQWGPANVDATIKSTAQSDGKKIPVRIEQEGGSSGKSTIASYTKLLAGWDFQGVHLGQNKMERAKAFRSQVEAHNVYLVRGEWNESFIDELTNFPTGLHDDQVDAVSCAYNTMLLEPPPRKVKSTW